MEGRDVAGATGGARPERSAALTGLLAYFRRQDVAVKVISGDSPDSVGAIARELGIAGGDHPVDARSLADTETEAGLGELGDALAGNSVFGRVTPRQKQQFVTALQARGHTVAMTG